MDETLFFRLLREEDKAAALERAVAAVRDGGRDDSTHAVDSETFRMLPGAPFAYWVSDGMRRKFKELSTLRGTGYTTSIGASTKDDFRFVRAAWEVAWRRIGWERGHTADRGWVTFHKGGELSPYYADAHLLLKWFDDGAELKAFISDYRDRRGWGPNWTAALNGYTRYFCSGLTWPRRTQAGLSVRAMPRGCAFADKGPAIFGPVDELPVLLSLTNSLPGRGFVELQMAFGSYEVGVLRRLPVPTISDDDAKRVSSLARAIHDAKRDLDRTCETSHAFTLPALLAHAGLSLTARHAAHAAAVCDVAVDVEATQREIDEVCWRLYDISAEDRATIEAELGTDVKGLPEPHSAGECATALVSWFVGVALGRFDVRLATSERPIPELGDAFDALPIRSPGMLPDGPIPDRYPLVVDPDGIMVNDEGHPDDLVAAAQRIITLLFPESTDPIERELCEMLGVRSLRDYFGRAGKGGFWEDHVKRYSKSRRKAPIWWLLQSPRGLYQLYLSYHSLDRDTLPKVLGRRYIGGKIEAVKTAIKELRGEDDRRLSKTEERRLADLDALLADVEEMAKVVRETISRQNDRGETVGYAPNLDDGVVLNAAPLHALIPWKQITVNKRRVSELEKYWEALEAGEYDWSHIAVLYWPTRVTEKCRTNKSLALAHGLDQELFPGLRESLRRQAEEDDGEQAEGDATDDLDENPDEDAEAKDED